MGSAKHKIFLLFIVAIYLANSIPYLVSQSVNADEGAYVNYAIRYLKGDPERTVPRRDNSMMPVIAWNLVPRLVEQLFHPGLVKHDEGKSDIMNGRFMSLLVGLMIMGLLYKFGSGLYGKRAGLIAAFFFCICPNMLANSAFASTDIYSSLVLLLAVYLYWRWSKDHQRSYFLAMAGVVALGQVTKQSLTYLYLLLPLMMVVRGDLRLLRWSQILTGFLVFICIQVGVINLVYYFHHSFMPIGEYAFLSKQGAALQAILPPGWRVPLPEPYITGVDQALYYNQLGGGFEGESCFGKVTILGKSFTGEGIWYYYLVSLLFKTPISLILFFMLAVTIHRHKIPNKAVLLLPVIFFLVMMSLTYKVQAGIRHIIFLYPFIFLLAAAWASRLWDTRWRWVFMAGVVFWVVSISRYWESFYPYTNELIVHKENAWRWVGHANLDIHQGYIAAEKYLAKHPGVRMLPDEPQKGVFLVSVNDYLDIWNTGRFAWIQQHPVSGEVAYTWLIVEVP